MALRAIRRRLWIVVPLGVLVVVLVTRQLPSRGRTVHDDGGGVLSASSGFGGNSIYPPPPPPWTASFGTLVLCVHHPGERARIDAVRAEVGGEPLRVRHELRVVPPLRDRPPGFSWVAYGSSERAFPGREDGGQTYGGTVHRVQGAVISQTCADAQDARMNGYTDLLTELTVDERGAMVKRTYVDYSSGGRRYTLVIRWEMTACGTAMKNHCGR